MVVDIVTVVEGDYTKKEKKQIKNSTSSLNIKKRISDVITMERVILSHCSDRSLFIDDFFFIKKKKTLKVLTA